METDETASGNQPNAGALSIYGQTDAAMDDFPVLKAFQQYIDAEQSKSRKRMILLCMFFGALMTILVAVFVFMLAQMNRDKQHVNDQLIEFLMKERDRAPVPTPQPLLQPAANPANDAALKAMAETLNALKTQIAEQKKAAEEEAERAPSKAEIELERKAEREAAKLRKIQSQLDEEKRRLADEKERLRQQEIERQRRRLYPDYYERSTTPTVQKTTTRTPAPKPRRELTDQDIDDILREVDSLRNEEVEEKKPSPSKKPADKKSADKKSAAKKDDKPIEYFTDSEYALPVKVNGEDAGFTIPLPEN